MAKQPAKAPETLKNNETLNGSNTLPALIEISPTQGLQLGEVVMAAHKASGLSVEAWNALAETERDELLNKTIEHLKGKAALLVAVDELQGLPQPHVPEPTPMMFSERVYIISAPGGPRRRAGLSFGPVPVELTYDQLGDDPDATLEALCADPMLKIDGRYEERLADAQD